MKTLIIILIILASVKLASSQEVHYSQYDSMPLYLNPANTGSSSFDFRGALDYRNQWSNVTVPFSSQYVFGDVKLPCFFIERSWFGLGISFLNDQAGNGLSSIYGSLSLAWHKSISRGNDWVLSIGTTAYLVNKSVDYSKIYFGDQWINNSFGGLSKDNQGASSFFYPDITSGVKLTHYASNGEYSFGLSYSHINQPTESFYKLTNNLARKLTLHTEGSIWAINKSIQLKPSVVVDLQDTYKYALVGMLVQKPFNADRTKSIILGLSYRTTVELIPSIGLEFGDYKIITTYDIPFSNKLYSRRGGFEISLTYTTGYSNPIERISKYKYLRPKAFKKGAIPCPKFKY